MKNIDNIIFMKVCKSFNLIPEEYIYYNSGKCSDLYLNKRTNTLLKINLWHIKTDNKKRVLEKLQSKLKFVNYLEENNYPIIGIKKTLYEVIDYKNNIYVAYFMDFKPHNNELIDSKYIISLIKKFHDLSKKYQVNASTINSWQDDFYSIISLCDDKDLKNKMFEFKAIFDNKSHDDYGYLHFDINCNNCIISNYNIYMIDFDTMTYGWYLMDVANYMFNYSVISFKDNLFKPVKELNKLYEILIKNYDENINIHDLEMFLRYRRLCIYIILKKGIDIYNLNVSNKIKSNILNNKSILI